MHTTTDQKLGKERPGDAPDIEMGIKPNGHAGSNGIHAANGKSHEPILSDLNLPIGEAVYENAPKSAETFGRFIGLEDYKESQANSYQIVYNTKKGIFETLQSDLDKPVTYNLENLLNTKVEEKVNLPASTVQASTIDKEVDFEAQLEAQRLRNRMSDLNNLALLELEDLAREKAFKDREAKGRDFRKRIWEGIKSPWQTLKGAAKSVFSFVEGINPKVKSYQKVQAVPQRKKEELFETYKNEKLMLQSKAHLKYEFIKENGREAFDDAELLNFKGLKADILLKAHTNGYNYWTDYEESDEHKDNLKEIANSSAYLRFKQSPRAEVGRTWDSIKEWHNNSWLNKPVVASLKEFGNAPATWTNLKAFFAGKDSVYTYPERKTKPASIQTAAYYEDSSESNTNSGVSSNNRSGGNNNGNPKRNPWRSVLAGMAIGLAAVGGLFVGKKSQQAEENYKTAAAMVTDTKAGNEKQANVATIDNESLESAGTNEPVTKQGVATSIENKPCPKENDKNISGADSTAKAKSVLRRPVNSRSAEKPKLESKVEEVKPNSTVEQNLSDVLSMEEMDLARNSLKTRIANLKAKIKDPGYIVPFLPEGSMPLAKTDIIITTSTEAVGVSQSESYESHIILVEGILAKDKFSKAELEKAEKALTFSENRMANNISAVNIARYQHAYNTYLAAVRERLKSYRILAKQQFSDGKTKSENQYMIPNTNSYMDINKLEQELAKLPADFRNEAFAKWSNESAKWFADHRAPKNY